MPDILRTARGVGVAVAIAAYAVLMHHVNASGRPGIMGAFLAMAPVFLIGLAMLSNTRWRLGGLLLLGVSGLLFWRAWSTIAHHSGLLFWIQDMGLLLTLLATFGRTLVGGRAPLCVTFAEMVHGPLSAAHERYARQVTVAWAGFFGLLAAISTLLFLLTPLTVWSVYANFMVLPLVALMFVAEYLVRRRVLSDASHGHILDAVNAYLKSSRPHG
jgi:uncharacterized membrane protein